jgi:hypothetical protein
MLTQLLTTKLYVPSLRLTTIPRPRLVERLDNEIAHNPLTLIAAPAGFGKTTVLSAWLDESGRRAAWLSLDEGDNEPARFLAYCIAALQTHIPDIGAGAQTLLQSSPLPPLVVLIFHPIGDLTELLEAEQFTDIDVYAFIAPVADRFIAVHVLFAPLIALMGLAVVLLINRQQGLAAVISRIAAAVFVVTYIMYETVIGTASGVLVRLSAPLSADEQAVIAELINRLWNDPTFGDGAVIATIAMLSWVLAVTAAAVSLYRSGKPLGACLLLGFSFMFAFHAPPLGPIGLGLFLIAVWRLEQASIRQTTNPHEPHLKAV